MLHDLVNQVTSVQNLDQKGCFVRTTTTTTTTTTLV